MHEGRLECRFIEATISEVQSALLRRGVMRAGFWAAAAAMVATAALLAIDGITGFAAGMRPAVYGLAMAAGAAVVGAAMFAGRAEVLPPICVAGLIEQARPDLKNALVTFVELSEDPAANPSMAAAVGRRAAMILAESEIDEFVAMGCVRRAAWAAMGGACLLGATLWLVGGVLFNFGPAAAQAGLMGMGAAASEGVSIRREPDAAAAGEPVASPAAATFGQTPDAEKSAAGSGAAAEAQAQSLAASLRADQEKFGKLAAALGEKQGGASAAGGGQGADACGAGGGADEGGAAGQTPSTGDSGRAQGSTNSGSRTNDENRPAAGGNSPAGEKSSTGGNSPNAPNTTGGAPNAGVGDKAGDTAGGKADGKPGGNSGDKPGGNVGPGGAAAAGDVPSAPKGQATAPPLTKRPQSDAFPEKTLDAMRTVRRLIDEADKRLREGEVSDAFLSRMGMSNAEFRRFVAGWQRQIETAPREADGAASGDFRIPSAGAAGGPGAGGPAPKLEFSPGGGGSDARPIRGLAPQAAAIQGGAVQGADTSVSVRLRPAVSAYFEKVGSLAAEKAGAKAAQ